MTICIHENFNISLEPCLQLFYTFIQCPYHLTFYIQIVNILFIYVLIWYIYFKSCNPPYKYYTTGNLIFHTIQKNTSICYISPLFTSRRPSYKDCIIILQQKLTMEQYIELTSQPNKNNLLFLILQIVTFLFCVLHIQILLKTSPTFRMCIKISIQFKHILFAYKLQMGLDTSYDNISEILSLKSQYTSLIKEKHIMTQYFIFFKIE